MRKRLALCGVLALWIVVVTSTSQCATVDPATRARGLAAWDTVYRVLLHPRCANCHPDGDVPLQGDDQQPHAQNVQRGPHGNGRYAMRCSTCHQATNTPGPNMPPGAPHWQLPPPKTPMVFFGRSKAQLARQLKDPSQTGGRSLEALLKHMREDPLVLWGWSPGEGRTPVPVPHDQFVAAMQTWIECGAVVPD